MTLRGVLYLTFLVLAGAGLSGCYENPRDVTLHEPGVYKGPVDPLLDALQKPGLQQQLQERFNLVQTDR
jgi:hypothetical protein